MNSKFRSLKEKIIKFRNERDWQQFHNPKDLAISISIEAAELLQEFQWKNIEDIKKKLSSNKDSISEEIADIFIYLILISDEIGINILDIAEQKMIKNAKKYPIDKSKGNAKKYTEL